MTERRSALTSCLAVAVFLVACGDPASPESIRPAAQETPPDVIVELICETDGSTQLLTSAVEAQEDGVHVQVDNRTGEGVSINGLGADFGEGISEQSVSTPPGKVGVACWPYSRHEDEEPPLQILQIGDPHGYWVDPALECEDDMIASMISDFLEGADGEQGDPVNLVRATFKGLDPSDVVELAAYTDQDHPVVRVVRDGKAVATGSFSPAGGGGWLMGGSQSCASSGISSN